MSLSAVRLLCTAAILAWVGSSAAASDAVLGPGAEHVLTIHTQEVEREVPPGVVGWGAMWKRKMLWPAPPAELTDASHAAYLQELARANAPLIAASDTRHLSWPWGVSFSTWGVNWENSIGPWSRRKRDHAQILARRSGWNEKAVVGVGDLLMLARHWKLEAITVSVPLMAFDGHRQLWGANGLTHTFSDDAVEKIADHAARLVAYMRRQPGWRQLRRVYVSAGCEWRHYSFKNPSDEVRSYVQVVRRMREKIRDDKVVIVASASDGADIHGIEALKTATWNKFLHEGLADLEGVALDLHRYRGMMGLTAGANGRVPLTPAHTDLLLKTGVTQRGFFVVDPKHWRGSGKPLPSVILEAAIHGRDADHAKRSDAPRPWAVTMAHADLVREALASPTQAFLGWTWFPEDLPPEWPHGALLRGELAPHARAQAFLSRGHRGQVLRCDGVSKAPVRGNATRPPDRSVRAYGGNFSRSATTLGFRLVGARSSGATVEILTEDGTRKRSWDGRRPLDLPAMSLWRVRFR